jgi:hypothetical protein
MIPDWIQQFADDVGAVVTEIPGEADHTVRNIIIVIIAIVVIVVLIAR